MRILVAAFVMCILPLQAGAQERCSMMACVDGLTINIDPNYKWEAGNYKFHFNVDGESLYCEGTLPFSSCEPNVRCDRADMMIMESGCAMPKETHGFGDISLYSSPKSMTLEVKRNEIIIGKGSFQPTYTYATPNGEMCEPKCKQATVQFEFK
ncbi:MAG: hypothetical protein ABL867_10510 [Rickettsiales bacterium]